MLKHEWKDADNQHPFFIIHCSKTIKYKLTISNYPGLGFNLTKGGELKDILVAKGVPIVTDPEIIKRVLKGKEIELNHDGSYQRRIGGDLHTKILLGNPK